MKLTFPLIRDVSMEDTAELAVLHEEDANRKKVANGQKEAHVREALVVLHEERSTKEILKSDSTFYGLDYTKVNFLLNFLFSLSHKHSLSFSLIQDEWVIFCFLKTN